MGSRQWYWSPQRSSQQQQGRRTERNHLHPKSDAHVECMRQVHITNCYIDTSIFHNVYFPLYIVLHINFLFMDSFRLSSYLFLHKAFFLTNNFFSLRSLVLHIDCSREVTRRKSKSGAVVKHQRKLVVLKTTSNVKWHFKSSAVPLYCSLVTSLLYIEKIFDTSVVPVIIYM